MTPLTAWNTPWSSASSLPLFACVLQAVPGITLNSALYLDYDVEPDFELPVVTLLACSYLAIWTGHKDNKALTPAHRKAALQVRVHTLRHTAKHQDAAKKLHQLLYSFS